MKIQWSDRALLDLVEIGEYIAQDRPLAAKRLLGKFRHRVRHLRQMPYAGRSVPRWELEEVRELIESGYRIVYHVKDKQITIVTVFDGHRQFPLSLEQIKK